jgi:ankyrin repeat protein
MMTGPDDAAFHEAVQGLHNGDFSRLEPLFAGAGDGRQAQVITWHEEGRFRDEPRALAEALTCACFLGRTDVAEHLLEHGVDPSGGAGTGLNALHWAANRGQLEAVRLLLRWKAPLATRNRYGGNELDIAVWSAIHEPRSGQREIIEELLRAGARLESERWPTGHEQIDALLRP